MRTLLFLLEHSRANPRQFWLGMVGKATCELLPVFCWIVLFGYILFGWSYELDLMVVLSLAVIIGQWLFGQSAKQSFLGAYEITHHLRSTLLRDICSQPMSLITGQGLGKRIKLVTQDLKHFEDIFSHLIAELFAAFVIPLIMLFTILVISPALAALLSSFIALAVCVLLWQENHFSQHSNQLNQSQSEYTGKVLEFIECLPTLKSFGRSDKLAKPLDDKIEQLKTNSLNVEWAGGLGVVLATLILELSIPILSFVAAYLAQVGILTGSQCLVVILACVACVQPFIRIATFSTLLRYMLKSATRLSELAKCEHQPGHGTPPTHSQIELNGVNVQFDDKFVLKDINLTIGQGEHIAIVGLSGAGKSTLLNVIAAFQTPNQGQVSIGGSSVEVMGTFHWYKQLTYITQEVMLCAGSLKDNLLIANKNATDEQINRAIEQAGLNSVICRLPSGIDSEIGENGNLLSGGEKQRLSIARALLHDTPIVLLDEFTSALDYDTQSQVLKQLKPHFANKTVITIAHRLDTILDADNIVVLDQGNIVDIGPHTDLIKRCRPYARLWNNKLELRDKYAANNDDHNTFKEHTHAHITTP